MINWSNYVGIPFKFNGSDRDGADCVGLVRMVYREQGWNPDFDDGKPVEQDWYIKSPYRLVRYLCRNFDKVKNLDLLEPGDLVYFRHTTGEGHVAIWIGYGKILQAAPAIQGISQLSHIGRIKHIQPFIVCGFKRRK